MKKLFISVCLIMLTVFVNAQQALTIYVLKGPSGVGLIRLFEDVPAIKGFNVKIEALGDSQLMAGRFAAGEAKIGILPPNVAAKLAAGGKNIQIAAVTGGGMLSLLSNDAAVKGIKNLKGKTINVAGQGAVPEFVFRKVLAANKINPDKDVKLDYSLAYPEIAQSLIAGRIQNALLPEPFATMAQNGSEKLKSIGDIQGEWVKTGAKGNFPMTVLVVDGDFAQKNPDAVKIILDSVEKSINWVIANPAGAGDLVEKNGLGLKAGIVAVSVPRSAYCFIRAASAKPQLEALFKSFLEYAPESIGGKLPKDDFYLK